jgi:hypothetical protein
MMINARAEANKKAAAARDETEVEIANFTKGFSNKAVKDAISGLAVDGGAANLSFEKLTQREFEILEKEYKEAMEGMSAANQEAIKRKIEKRQEAEADILNSIPE